MSPHTSSVRRRVGRRRALAGVFAAAAALAAGVAVAVTVPTANAGSIPAATMFYVDPNSQVNRWIAANPNDSRRPLIQQRIGFQPQGIWFANYRPNTVTADVQAITGPAASQSKVPVLVAYMLPNRDCGGASAGGAPTIAEYNTWVQRFAAGLGSSPVIVILEPDSIALITCLDANALSQRYGALGQAARTIKAANPQAKVYFDGGHSNWNSATEQANRLRSAGVANGDGVYTNVSNFRTTDAERTFVKAILNNLGNGNLRGVIDTSRNGRGPLGSEWCDPAGRGIGANPTADTFDAQIDAYLWVKPPGESDGCSAAAGTFSAQVAYDLALNGVPVTVTPTTPSRTTATPSSTRRPPGAPTDLRLTGSSPTSVSVAWNASPVGSLPIHHYRLSWTGAATGFLDIHPSQGERATVTGLTPNSTYQFVVDATDGSGGDSPPSNTLTVTTPGTSTTTSPVDTEAPSVPGSFTAAQDDNRILMSWGPSTDNVGVTGYEVYKAAGSGPPILLVTTTGVSWSDNELFVGNQYTYYVRARDAAGNTSGNSNSVTVRYLGPTTLTPTTPTGGGTNCRVSYVKQSEWNGGFVAQVRITNTGTTAINNWSLAWTFANGQRVISQWNATISPTTGSVTATHVGWNSLLAPNGGVADFGFQGTWSGANPAPTAFTLNGAPCAIA